MNTTTLIQEVNQLHANICAALADPSRILILYLLSEGPLNVNALVEKLDLPQPTVSRHLKVLRERGLVLAERDGQSVFYDLADHRVIKALDLLRTVLGERLAKQASLAHTVSHEYAGAN
jgi:DNA-binding transcriptional ArsR family regulator